MRKSNLKLAYERPTEHIYGSSRFIALDRNPELKSPERFVPTVKAEGDIVL